MNKFLILIIVGIFLIPISSVVPLTGGLWYSQYLSLLLLLFLGVAFFLWDFNKYLAIFDIACILSTFFVTNTNARAIVLLFNLNLGCLGAYLISKFNYKQRNLIIKSIFVLTLLQSVWLLLQLYNISIPIDISEKHIDATFCSIYNPNKKELVAFSASPDQLGSFFALTFPVALYINPVFGIISLVGIFLSKSAFALVSALVGGTIYIFYISRKSLKLLLIVILLILIVYFGYTDKIRYADFQTRGNVWRYAVKSTLKGELDIEKFGKSTIVETNPIYGFGFGQFLTLFPFVPQKDRGFNYIDEKFNHAHNDIVEICIFELGIIGIYIFVLLLVNFLREFISAKKSKELMMIFSCILIYLLNSTGNFLSQIAVSGMLLILFYGMFKGVIKNGKVTASC